MALHCKALDSSQELLVQCQMAGCLVIFEDFAKHFWLLLQSQLQFFEFVLDDIARGCQRSKGIGQTCVFSIGGTQTDFGDQL